MSALLPQDAIVVANPKQVSADLGNEAAILKVDTGLYYGLNEVGARIWQLVQTPTTIGDIVRTIVTEYEVERERCERDVRELLAKLYDEGLLDIRDDTHP